jgi:L-ascorbate metabolism protein UlaG (beta-lactamase superfamily)
VIKGKDNSIIHTGDSGYGDHFKKIGEKYGPFDFTMVECGQYNVNWHFIHMMPEETVQAHIDLKGKYLLPIHWGRFNLALHSWTDPILRASAEAETKGVDLISPVAGQTVTLTPPMPHQEWWAKKDKR